MEGLGCTLFGLDVSFCGYFTRYLRDSRALASFWANLSHQLSNELSLNVV